MSTLSLSVSSLTRGSRSSKPYRVCSALPLTGGGPPGLGNHLRMLHVLQLGPSMARLPACHVQDHHPFTKCPLPKCTPRRPGCRHGGRHRPPRRHSRTRVAFNDSGTGRGVQLSLDLSLSGVSCIQGKVGLVRPGVSVCPLSDPLVVWPACPDGSARPWNAPCWADPRLWVSLGVLPTASVVRGKRVLPPFWSALAGSTPFLWWRGFRGTLERSPPSWPPQLCLPSAVALVGLALPRCVRSRTGGL